MCASTSLAKVKVDEFSKISQTSLEEILSEQYESSSGEPLREAPIEGDLQ
jgi:hypothetical protein